MFMLYAYITWKDFLLKKFHQLIPYKDSLPLKILEKEKEDKQMS